MSVKIQCDICGRTTPYFKALYSLDKETLLGDSYSKVFDVCEDCVKRLKEMRKDELKKFVKHS